MRKFFLKFKKRTQNEDGAVMILMVFLIIILLGFAALAFDYGMVYYKDSKLQTAVDIAARAAAREYADIKEIAPEIMSDEQKEQALEEIIEYYLEENGFPQDQLKVCNISADVTGEISIDARADVDLNFARVFTDKPIPISAGTAAITEVQEETVQKVGVDVVFVLDLSSSMFRSQPTPVFRTRFKPMVEAVNNCIDMIVKDNPYNRVSIVTYSCQDDAETRVILSLTDDPENTRNEPGFVTFSPNYLGYSPNSDNSEEGTVYLSTKEHRSIAYNRGGTYIQYGIATGGMHLSEMADQDRMKPAERDIVRFPAVFVLTDGEATRADVKWNTNRLDDYKTVDHSGAENAQICSYYTILTANYWKDVLTHKYTERNGQETKCKFYTLGFELDHVDGARQDIAKGLMNPEYFDINYNSMWDNAKELRNDLKNYDSRIPYLGDKNYYYVDHYYDAKDKEQLQEELKKFALEVVEPAKTYTTKLVK